MKFLKQLSSNLFKKDNSWAVRLMAIEYKKDFVNLQKMGVKITPDIALNYITNIGGKNDFKY